MARRLGKAHIARNNRRIHLAGEVALDLLGDLHGEVGAPIEHRQQHTLQLQPRVHAAAHDAHGVHQIGKALERVILALHGHEQGVRRAQRVERQQLERGRTVDENVVVVGGENVERLLEPELAVRQVDHLNARAGQRLGGGQHVAVARGDDGGLHIRAVDEHVVDALRHGLVHAHAGGGVRLRVKVAQQHALAALTQRGGQIDAGGRLADTALLIDDRYDFCQKRHPPSAGTA